jgi:hypothetical protein
MMQVPLQRSITLLQKIPQLSRRRQGVLGQLRIWPLGQRKVTVHAAAVAERVAVEWAAIRAATSKRTLDSERTIDSSSGFGFLPDVGTFTGKSSYYKDLISVNAGEPVAPPGHKCPGYAGDEKPAEAGS